MKCQVGKRLLESYLDGELDRARVDELEVHLARCGSCCTELVSLEQLRARLREVTRYRAPRELHRQLQAIDEPQQQVGSERSFGRWPAWAIAASLLLAFVLGAAVSGLYVNSANQQQTLAQEVLTSHLRALAAASPVDVASEDRHTVKPWFAGKVAESPPVADLSEQGFPLIGGRIDYVGGQRTAVLVYRHRQHQIDVYLTSARARPMRSPVQLQGYWIAPGRIGERSAWIVSDADRRELLRLRDLLENAASAETQTQ